MLHNANIYNNSKGDNARFLYMLKVVRKCSILLKKQKLEDLKVLRRSPDLLNNVKIGQDQLQLDM